jgi:hypothetical protein
MTESNGQEKMVPLSQALRMLRMGAEAQAGLFIGTYWRLKDLLGADRAVGILREAMCDAYTRLGREVAEEVGRTDARGMAQAWELLYGAPLGGEGTVELTDDLWILEGHQCTACSLMKRWGVSDRELALLADAFCVADAAFAAGFNPEMKFQHTHRLMGGDLFCRWVHSTEG